MPDKTKRIYMASDTWISLISNLATTEAIEQVAHVLEWEDRLKAA